jgi:hypothetical protein
LSFLIFPEIALTIEQLQPLTDLLNPYLLKLDNPYLHLSVEHNLDASLFNFRVTSLQFWQGRFKLAVSQYTIPIAATMRPFIGRFSFEKVGHQLCNL